MSNIEAIQLSKTRWGRIRIHAYMSFHRDHKWLWHLMGIIREIKKA